MEYLVWLPLPVILFFAFKGFKDGVVKRVVEIVGIIATLILTARFATAALPWMIEHTGLSEGPALLITWAALFLVGFLLSKLLAAFIGKVFRLTLLGWVDRGGGAVLGAAIGILFCSVILVALSQITGGQKVQRAYEETAWGSFLFHAAPNVYRQVQRLEDGKAGEVWDRVLDTTRRETGEAVQSVRGSATDAAGKAAKDAVKEEIDEARDQIEEKLDDVKDAAGG